MKIKKQKRENFVFRIEPKRNTANENKTKEKLYGKEKKKKKR